mgnify:FL=1
MPMTSLLPAGRSSAESPATEETLLPHLEAGGLALFTDPASDKAMMFCAARNVTAGAINQMALHARGLVSLALSSDTVARLGLPMQPVRHRNAAWGQTVSIEASEGITTGISAAERAHTIRTATAADARPEDIVSPGHVFPVSVGPNGLNRQAAGNVLSHLDAVLQLVRMAGAGDGAVISQVLGPDGNLATVEEAMLLAGLHDWPTIDEAEMRRCYKPQCLRPVDIG